MPKKGPFPDKNYLSREQPDWFVPGQVADDILGRFSAGETMALPNQ
ncbi:hypothetical protein [Desulfonatronum thioautotrophicum]|nr:hypothetical protein [Desulfonatronum thioautotrophicum]